MTSKSPTVTHADVVEAYRQYVDTLLQHFAQEMNHVIRHAQGTGLVVDLGCGTETPISVIVRQATAREKRFSAPIGEKA